MFKSTACGRITSTSKPTFVVNIVSASRDVDGESGRGEARRGDERRGEARRELVQTLYAHTTIENWRKTVALEILSLIWFS